MASVHSFLYLFKILLSGIDKSSEWSTIPACPSLMCCFSRNNIEGNNSSKFFVFDVCVLFVLCQFVSGLILWFLYNLSSDDFRAE